MKSNNKYDYLLIFLIGILIFGYYGSPLYPSRLLALAISPMVLKGISHKSVYIPPYVKYFLLICLFFGCISLLWSYDRIAGVKAIFYSFCNVISFLSLYICALKASNPIRSILLGWLFLFLLTVPIALGEFITGMHFSNSFQSDDSTMLNSDGLKVYRIFASVTYGNLNKYNVIVCFCIPFILCSLHYFKNILMRGILWITIFLVIYIVTMNASRGALLVLLISMLVFAFSKLREKNKLPILIFISCVVYIILVNPNSFAEQMIGRFLNSGIKDTTRENLYIIGFRIFKETLTLGVGGGGISAALKSIPGNYIIALHNMFLEFLLQYGLIPFIFYIRFIYKIYMGLWHSDTGMLRMFGVILVMTALPLFIINSNYVLDTDLWLFFGSIFTILMISRTHKTIMK